ncbi:heme-binding domain-containing protein [Mangrovibacterium lignilyticum]|uniref:heme-binding domain-containing protein n=1 Tax=Mangrovibacterium lignilyticum TaxID=2668052 RepID=UPI0013CF5489|nr:heme-binding domain-containing protein [Mangrovibacterium lignilyticum]
MRKFSLLFMLLIAVVVSKATGTNDDDSKISYPMPTDVKMVIESKCFNCHNDEARGDKSKKALNFSTFSDLSTIQKIAGLNDIKKEVVEGEMPPKKMLERHPEAALTPEETQLLVEWVKSESQALLKK